MNNSPIGVFDSGLGGLSVWSELKKILPNESLLYYGDGKNCPYGDKSAEQVREHVDFAVRRMLDMGVKMVVIACNAATTAAIDHLRSSYKIPFVGLEPAVKPAALGSKSGVIGVLATAGTLKGRHFLETSKKYSNKVEIVTAVGRGFVELVENNMERSPEALVKVWEATQEMIERGADMIVLGCTHYPFLEEAFGAVIGDRDIQLVNPSEAIGHRVDMLLDEYDLRATCNNVPEYSFFTSADREYKIKLEAKAANM